MTYFNLSDVVIIATISFIVAIVISFFAFKIFSIGYSKPIQENIEEQIEHYRQISSKVIVLQKDFVQKVNDYVTKQNNNHIEQYEEIHEKVDNFETKINQIYKKLLYLEQQIDKKIELENEIIKLKRIIERMEKRCKN